jgi:hypothetical protein
MPAVSIGTGELVIFFALIGVPLLLVITIVAAARRSKQNQRAP